MATFGTQVTEIEYLILHGKPRAKRQGIEQARTLLNSLSSQRKTIEDAIASRAPDAPDLPDLHANLEDVEVHIRRLDPFFRLATN